MFTVYILRSLGDGKLYIGQTNNLTERLKRHNEGYVKATKSRRPFELLVQKSFNTRSEAIEMESYLKSLKGGNEFKRVLQNWGLAKR